jgi:hypothetical protein
VDVVAGAAGGMLALHPVVPVRAAMVPALGLRVALLPGVARVVARAQGRDVEGLAQRPVVAAPAVSAEGPERGDFEITPSVSTDAFE